MQISNNTVHHYSGTWRTVQQVLKLSARKRPAVNFREFTVRILCILLSSILQNNTEEHLKNRVKKYRNYTSGLRMTWPIISNYFCASPSVPIFLKIVSFQKLSPFLSSSGADKKKRIMLYWVHKYSYFLLWFLQKKLEQGIRPKKKKHSSIRMLHIHVGH